MVNPRTKGANAEREAAAWLQQKLNLEHTPQRNLEQVRFKGTGRIQQGQDLVGIAPFCIEIKRQEKLSLKAWWLQCVFAAKRMPGTIPVVMYRQNNKQWQFLISAKYCGIQSGYVHLETKMGINWMLQILKQASE